MIYSDDKTIYPELRRTYNISNKKSGNTQIQRAEQGGGCYVHTFYNRNDIRIF